MLYIYKKVYISGYQDVDGGGGNVLVGLAAPPHLQRSHPPLPQYQLVSVARSDLVRTDNK